MNGYLQESIGETESFKESSILSPGERLKKRRESIGLTHADVAGHLNLRISIIEAIEADDYKSIPKLVFARGYLRAYAKLMGISGNEIIETFNKLEYQESPSEIPASPLRDGQKKPAKKEHSFTPWIALIILIILFAIVGFWKPISSFLTQTQFSSTTSNQIVTTTIQSQQKSALTSSQAKKEKNNTSSSEESSSALPDLDQFKEEN